MLPYPLPYFLSGYGGVVTYENVHLPSPRPDFPDNRERVEDAINEMRYYCAYTPYMFAYVVLVLQWIFLPILLCCSCMIVWTMFCALCCAAASGSGTTTYSATATSDPSVTARPSTNQSEA